LKHEHEHFTFLRTRWDVALGWRLVAQGEVEVTRGPCRVSHAPTALIAVDDEYVETMTEQHLEVPLLLVLIDDVPMCIDGWHRIRKAQKLGVEELPAVLVHDDSAFREDL
jgi:hypothetical protein